MSTIGAKHEADPVFILSRYPGDSMGETPRLLVPSSQLLPAASENPLKPNVHLLPMARRALKCGWLIFPNRRNQMGIHISMPRDPVMSPRSMIWSPFQPNQSQSHRV